MIKQLMVFMIALCVLMIPVSVLAQEKIHPAQANSTAAFKAKKGTVEKKMKDIENLVTKIANQKRASKVDGEDLDKLMLEHAKAMDDSFKQSLADAKEAEKSKWQKGSTKSFVEFEDMAQKHEKRAKAVEAKVKKIADQIKTGDVELDQPLLESMTPAERKEYMQYMTPSGREKMKKKHPKLLSGISVETETKLVDMGKSACALCRSTAQTVGELLVSIAKTTSDLLIPPAEGAIGAGAGATCGATVIGCVPAVVTAAFLYSQATDDLYKCYAGQCSCRWYKPWCCAGRTGCWIAYLVKCA